MVSVTHPFHPFPKTPPKQKNGNKCTLQVPTKGLHNNHKQASDKRSHHLNPQEQ